MVNLHQLTRVITALSLHIRQRTCSLQQRAVGRGRTKLSWNARRDATSLSGAAAAHVQASVSSNNNGAAGGKEKNEVADRRIPDQRALPNAPLEERALFARRYRRL